MENNILNSYRVVREFQGICDIKDIIAEIVKKELEQNGQNLTQQSNKEYNNNLVRESVKSKEVEH